MKKKKSNALVSYWRVTIDGKWTPGSLEGENGGQYINITVICFIWIVARIIAIWFSSLSFTLWKSFFVSLLIIFISTMR